MSLKAEDYIPGLKYGARLEPDDIATMVGLPYVGNIVWVDPSSGDDSANSGGSQDDALATVEEAEDRTVAAQHDVVIIAPTGGTGRTSETSAITWDKRFTHLVGSAAPCIQDTRAGMSFGASIATGFTASNNGCLFKNLTIATFQDNNGLVALTGSYNSFQGVDFKGIGNATAGDDTSARCLVITGGQENFFGGCTFGLDTVARSTTNATVEFASAASRNVFSDCRFVMHADNVGPNHILFTGTSAIDRWIEFRDCTWYAFWTNDVDKVTHCFDLSAQSATGHVLMTGRQLLVGFDDWEASDSGRMYFEPYVNTANLVGIGINPNVS